MNVLLISNYLPYTTSVLLKRGFEQAGHRVMAITPDVAPHDWIHCALNAAVSDLIGACPHPPDLLLFVESGAYPAFFPRQLLDSPIPTAMWAIDNHINYRWHKAISGGFDFTFLAQNDFAVRATKEMQSIVNWLPLAADYDWHAAPAEENRRRRRDVVFVGHLDRERSRFFDTLRAEIPSVDVVSGVYGPEVGQLYAEAKIGLNIALRNDLNMRFFEVLAAGALLVTENIAAGMRELLTEGEHYVTYDRPTAARTITKWLANDLARRAIAERGRAACLAAHLYRHRAQTIVSVIASQSGDFRARRRDKTRTARLFWEIAAVLRARPFDRAADAAEWVAAGRCRAGKLRALPAYGKYLKRHLVSYLRKRRRHGS